MKIPTIPDVDLMTVSLGYGAAIFLPQYQDIPAKYKKQNNPWAMVAEIWYAKGIHDMKWRAREGVDITRAVKLLQLCCNSREITIERKIAGMAYLMDLWFLDVSFSEGGPK